MMPSLPPEISQWLAPSVFLAVLGLILGLQGRRIDELRADLKASEARQQQDIKEVRADMKEVRADMKASEIRQQQDIKELRAELKADNRALGEKLDRLLEALATVKQS